MDLKSYRRWYDYSRARDVMFAATDTVWAPWYVADANDKRHARCNIAVSATCSARSPTSRWTIGTSSCLNGSSPTAT